MSEPKTLEDLQVEIAIDLFCLIKALEEDMGRCASNAEDAECGADKRGWELRRLGIENATTRVREMAIDYIPTETLNKDR